MTGARSRSHLALPREWEHTPSEFAALLLELRQIKRYRPRFNVVNKRDACHYAFIQITRGPAPKLQVTRRAAGARLATTARIACI